MSFVVGDVCFGRCFRHMSFFVAVLQRVALAEAAVVPLSVSVNRPLSLTGEELRVSVAGRSLGQLVATLGWLSGSRVRLSLLR